MDKSFPNINRETWLQEATGYFRHTLFEHKGYSVPNVKVSVGFPGGGSARKRIGEHWSPDASIDGLGSVFISPVLDGTAEVLAVLVHELVHAVVGNKHGHGKVFKRCALAVGLEGKMRSTNASKALISDFFEHIEKRLGPYPHGRLNLNKRPTKKQTTRMIKMECPECGYIARASIGAIEKHGAVLCPCNGSSMDIA
jgi:hypothetical protein